MQIDWLTVAAQTINFLVLVLLLQHFLYAPIVRAMDDREKNIALRHQEVQRKTEEAEREAAHYRAKLSDLEDAKGERLAAIQAEIDQERAATLQKARAEVEHLTRGWKSEVEREKSSFLKQVRQQLARQSVALTRKTLQDLAGRDLEEQLAARLIDRIRELPEGDAQALARSRDRRIEVRTSHPLPEAAQQRLLTVLHDEVAADLVVSFQALPVVGCGIALLAEGCRLEWSIEAYLDEVEKALSLQLQAEGKTGDHA